MPKSYSAKNKSIVKTITSQEIVQSLQQQFYVNIPFPIASTVINNAIQAFFKFLDEPSNVKSHIDFNIAPKHRRGEIGYRFRDPNDHIYNDSKEFFHYHPAIFKKYPDFLNDNPVVADFIEKAHPIWDLSYQTIQSIFELLEPNYPGISSKIFETPEVHLMLRFLKYSWQSSGKYLAKPHFDAGSCTLAIAESCPGLRIGSCPENLQLIEHQSQNAIFMLSSNFKKIMDSDQFSAGWHDVIQLDETKIGKPFARWAIVIFIEAHGVEALPRSETHKWYHEQEIPN